ncbi:MAG: DUF4411 family protein [Planctomycetes bacterium]|nr:DUF4411 family protein [Planctomycetota bacterium]MBU4400268.1 DUF4411 family protein [Planctomycetota bacterium]MCG2682962.1 DUF4411 family protein [Planctomycetales bacterium]
MADQSKYLLDANVLIEAHKRYYGFDLCPGFWTAIVRHHHAHRVFSIDRVKDEIAKGKDKLTKWAKSRAPETLFKKTDSEAIIAQFGKMIEWVQNDPQFLPAAKKEFARIADGWLIACAKAEGLIVVTEESYEPMRMNKVKIPNACRQFAVQYVNTFEMLRELRVRFVERPVTA